MKFKGLFVLILALIPLTVYGFVGVGFMGGSSPSSTVNWDLLNEDCSDISDWTDADTGSAVSEVDPAGQFRFDTNSGAASNDEAHRYVDFGSLPNEFTIKVVTYFDNVGLNSGTDFANYKVYQADELVNIIFATDGLFLYDTDSGYTEVGTDLVKEGGSAEWQTWWFLVAFTGTTGDGTCDVYLDDSTHNNEKVGTGINCSQEYAGTDGLIRLIQYGNTTDDMVHHIDSIQIATGLHTP